MEFPTLVDANQTIGNVATRILDKETAEYVTSMIYLCAGVYGGR